MEKLFQLNRIGVWITMDKRNLLQKLEQLQVKSINDFKTQDEIVTWSNKVAPILEKVYPFVIFRESLFISDKYVLFSS